MAESGGRDRAEYERDGELVLAARAGDDHAFAELFNRWFDSVFDAARRIVNDQEVAAEVAQDTFLAVWKNLDRLREPSTFGAFTLRTARNRALNRSERERRSVAVDDQDLVPVLDRERPSRDTAEVVTSQQGDDLVWAASVALGERDASLLDLHLRHGLTAPELAAEMGVTANNAHQLLFRMKKKLGVAIEGWVLWRGGSPSCERLETDLERAGITEFSAEAVRVIGRHVDQCNECGDRKLAALAPEAMFASVPIAIATPAIRDRVIAGLQQQGVPVASSSPGGSASDGSTSSSEPASTGADGAASPAEAPLPVDLTGDELQLVPESAVARRAVLAGVGILVLVLLIAGGIAVSRAKQSPTELIEASSPTSVEIGQSPKPTSAANGTAPDGADLSPGDTEPEVTTPVVIDDPEDDLSAASTATTTPANGPTTAPGVTFVVPPTATVPTTAPPFISNPTTTASTSPPPPPPPPGPPVIDDFSGVTDAAPGGPGCGSSQWRVRLSWATTDATSVTVTGLANPLPVDATNRVICRASPGVATYQLVASGPGGGPDTQMIVV